jgi:hypothetical protein
MRGGSFFERDLQICLPGESDPLLVSNFVQENRLFRVIGR